MRRTTKPGAMADRAAPIRLFSCVLLVGAQLCAASTRAGTVSYERDVLPILSQRCVMCHIPGAAQGDLALYPDAWANIVNVPSEQSDLLQIDPGNPDDSYFYLKLTDEYLAAGGSGEVMPPPQQGSLRPEEIDTIRAWIEEGAQRD
jgi:mono/diheme cytochrome c family protein